MSLVADAPARSAATEKAKEAPKAKAKARTQPVTTPLVAIRRTVAAAIAVAIVMGAIVAAFEIPLTRLWYDTRQHHLASDLATAHGHIVKGNAVGILQIPKLGVNLVVGQGDGTAELRGGPGHEPSTPMPGAVGNSVVFGHRQRWGAPFAQLQKLKVDDLFVFKVRNDKPVVFKVASVTRIRAEDATPLAPSDDHRITLVTGRGGRHSTNRLVVSAVSGEPGHLLPVPANTRGGPSAEPFTGNGAWVWFALVVLLLAAGLFVTRTYGTATRALIVVPPAITALLLLLLQLDLLVAPLR
jgi:sortase A